MNDKTFYQRNIKPFLRLLRACLYPYPPYGPIKAMKTLGRFRGDFINFNKSNKNPSFKAEWSDVFPCWHDQEDFAAGGLNYYFWQDLWAAQKIFADRPVKHFDIASSVMGFIAHVLTFMPVTMIDIRPLPVEIKGLDFVCADATNLEGIEDNSIYSLSSLCAIEHFGLGRYGDTIDPDACFKAMKSMQRVLAPSGKLYLAVPVGEDGVFFHAHRVFSVATILQTFDRLDLLDFSVIDTRDVNDIRYREHVDPAVFHAERCYWGSVVGLFEFAKKT